MRVVRVCLVGVLQFFSSVEYPAMGVALYRVVRGPRHVSTGRGACERRPAITIPRPYERPGNYLIHDSMLYLLHMVGPVSTSCLTTTRYVLTGYYRLTYYLMDD